jgi:hypothetical protein
MDPAVNAALNQPGWEKTFAMAVLYADTTIRKYIWRGFRPKSTGKNEITVGDKSAADFVQEALKRLIEGKRQYDSDKTLLDNLNSVTDSLIWSAKKQSDKTGIVDYATIEDEGGEPIDPISTAKSFELTPEEKLQHDELLEDQRRCFKQIHNSFDGDDAMQAYLDALAAGIFKRAEISQLTDLEPAYIDELRRKLIKHAKRIFGVSDFKEFKQRLEEGGL